MQPTPGTNPSSAIQGGHVAGGRGAAGREGLYEDRTEAG